MSIYDNIKSRLLNGWHLQQIVYTNGVKVYHVSQRINPDTVDTYATIGIDCVRRLRKEIDFTYIEAVKETYPLNFTPQRIEKGHASIVTA